MRVALLFIDGVGVGREDPARNPLARVDHLLSVFEGVPARSLPGAGRVHTLDPTFAVPGRPQSASNQTALLTGTAAPRLTGRHVLGYPDAPLRAILQEHSIIRRLTARGRRATFANSYPAAYLRTLGLSAARMPEGQEADAHVEFSPRLLRRIRPSATTLAFAAGEVPLRTLAHARAGLGLTHDIDGRLARERGLDVPRRTPEEAADILLGLGEEADFTLFEHYLADEAGHAQDAAAAVETLENFDRMLRRVVDRRPEDLTVLVCSDHGNVEDLSTRSHTLNRVPLLGFGPGAERLEALETLADVGTLVLRLLDAEP